MNTKPIPIATEFNSIDRNIVDQWIANSGPKINPDKKSSLLTLLSLNKNAKRKIEPKKVLIPTRDNELTPEVLIINGIVPQETASKPIKRYALVLMLKIIVVLVLCNY